MKNYVKENIDQIKNTRKKYYKNNKQKRLFYNKEWFSKNPSKVKQYRRDYYLKNKDKIIKKNKHRWSKMKKQYYQAQKEYQKQWRKDNPLSVLMWSVKSLKKQAKEFSLSVSAYKMALHSWAQVIKKRDKKCVVCGSKKKLEAHHILQRSLYPKLSFNINNGVMLCYLHHREIHS